MARKDVASIVSGAGWVCDFVGKLVDGLVTKGHTAEEIHSLVTAKQRPAMEKIVEEVSRFLNGIGSILTIDRTTHFDPVHFIGKGWSIWRGQVDGDGLTGDEDQDERSLALTEVDLSKIRIETCLHNRETVVGGEEKFLRLKAANYIRLDAKVFQTFWEHKDKIPEPWKEKANGNTRLIFFDGTILRSPYGARSVLYLYWNGDGWYWIYYCLGIDWFTNTPSAVLAS